MWAPREDAPGSRVALRYENNEQRCEGSGASTLLWENK